MLIGNKFTITDPKAFNVDDLQAFEIQKSGKKFKVSLAVGSNVLELELTPTEASRLYGGLNGFALDRRPKSRMVQEETFILVTEKNHAMPDYQIKIFLDSISAVRLDKESEGTKTANVLCKGGVVVQFNVSRAQEKELSDLTFALFLNTGLVMR